MQPGTKPPAYIACWPRGGGKSASVELGCVYVGMRETRRFVLYVSATQAQADAHVQSIAAKLEALGVDRALNKYQQSRGWTQQMLRAANGFNVVSLGLDAAARGIKLDDYRPDLIVLDDVDSRHDTPAAVSKKIATITESILPSGSSDAAVVFVQNKIHGQSVMAQVLDGRADFLQERMPPTEEPALRDFTYRTEARDDGTLRYVLSGIPTWDGQSLDICTAQANEWGMTAFRREAQHETNQIDNGLWKRDWIEQRRVIVAPPFTRVVVGIDPSATATGDEAGVITAGLGTDGHAYILSDDSVQAAPEQWAAAAVTAYHKYHADCLLAEQNNGGEMVRVTISTIKGAPPVKLVHASRGKATRAEPVAMLYEQGRVHHVGAFPKLEDELCSWTPGDASPNRMDSLVWCLTELMLGTSEGIFF